MTSHAAVVARADFFSCGTNDLTQMTMGFSRDDSGKFIKVYLDQDGVGQLVQMAVEKGRKVKKDLKVGICGEHGGDPDSVKFCHRIGLAMFPVRLTGFQLPSSLPPRQ